MIKISIPNNNIKEREYIINIIFNEFLGLEYQVNESDICKNWEIELENKTTQFLFLTLDNEKIGYIKYDYNSAKLKNSLDIDRIYLLDTHKNKGLGSKLLQKAESIAKEKNKSHLTLGVLKLNKPAISFYEKKNFTIFDEENISIGNNNYVLLHMMKNI